MLFDFVFYMFAVIVIVSAMGVVFSKKMMYSAFSLLFTFFGMAGLYVLLSADFVAVTQIMVYVGGILVLIVFGVMLTSKITGVDIKTGTIGKIQLTIGAITSVIVAIILLFTYLNVEWMTSQFQIEVSTTTHFIGFGLFTEYLLPFFVAAILLLVAFIGAAKIARRK